ncbi:MAG TPA: RimK family alpha-L-glutamate ligase [Xanthobacteraceae bacterium]|nr:RimK family alpha-L-glutamate ligase [Xanthobacteraceae bacterium]
MPHSADPRGREAAAPRVGMVIDGNDWHARELTKSLQALGVSPVPMRLEACAFATASASGLDLDGFGERLPDGVFVRTIVGGSFESVTLRLGILHALRERGVTVWNDARAIERCVDKSMTSFLLARSAIATPDTWTVQSLEAARAIVTREAPRAPLVLKPLFGSQGRGLRLIRTPDDLPEPGSVAGVYYLQRFVGRSVGVERDGFHDFRLLVSRGRVVAAMMRHSAEWITNIKRGGRPVAVATNDDLKTLAVRAAAAVGADFAGVDILYDGDQRPSVLEVNSMPAWAGLQKVASADIAGILAADLVAALDGHARRGATA